MGPLWGEAQSIMTDPRVLFVYGSLVSGFNHPESLRISDHYGRLVPGRMRGRLFRISWYPGLVDPVSCHDWVFGQCLWLNNPEATLPILDRYESCSPEDPIPHEYRRIIAEVVDENDWIHQAWTYRYQGQISGLDFIPSGRFHA